jgi:hypothetical protein
MITKIHLPYIIAIPTYKRHSTIAENTLKVLEAHHIPANKIYLFVADEVEKRLYSTTVPASLYGHIIVGVLGLHNQRNFISDYFPEGQYIIELDDDVTGIFQLTKSRSTKRMTKKRKFYQHLASITNLHQFFLSAFKQLEASKLYLFGVYPVCNGYFMTPTVTNNLRFIVGPFWGFINRHLPDLKLTMSEKEDSERTLQFYTMDGGVLRFNNITFKTNYYTNKGGMQAEGKNRKLESRKAAEDLHAKYPALTKISHIKKSGYTELKFVSDEKK